jgi:hypothetical protein
MKRRWFDLAGLLIILVCGWILGSAYNFFLVPNSGMHSFGGFPVSTHAGLRDFLVNHGFTHYSSFETNGTQTLEKFRGSYENSRPFNVTILTKDSKTLGVSVEVSWNYRGERGHSSDKAAEFANILDERLKAKRLASLQN